MASLFALTAPIAAVAANTWTVTSCLDDGAPGTLRSVINAPGTLSGDTVDLGSLSCPSSKITLATGGEHIVVGQNSLTIEGPDASLLTIDGSLLNTYYKNYSNVFYHTGTGTLAIKHLEVTGGHQSHKMIPSLGGCIYSKGSVSLSDAVVSNCSAYSMLEAAKGGGVYTVGNLIMSNSTISGNTATAAGNAAGGGALVRGNLSMQHSALSDNSATSSNYVLGGGAKVYGNFTAKYSAISGNQVDGSVTAGAGGLYILGNVDIDSSLISGNSSSGGFGGIDVFSLASASKTFELGNSTISNNSAAGIIGGLYVNSGTAKFYNSTIAYNTAATTNLSPGLHLSAQFGSMAVTLQSTLITGNTNGSSENDISTESDAVNVITFNAAPANNFVRASFASGLPADTLFSSCPRLGPLRDNGGATFTHALLSGSPAIDAGNHVGEDPYDQPYAYDQRWLPEYVRVSNGIADIGAYEVNQDDVIYNAGFEGCLDLI